MIVTGPIMKFDTPSANGRVYSRDAASDIMSTINFKDDGPVCGVLATGKEKVAPISEKTAFIAENAWIRDDTVMIRARLVMTPDGEIVKDMITHNIGAFSINGKMGMDKDNNVSMFLLDNLTYVNESPFDLETPKEVVYSPFTPAKDDEKTEATEKPKKKANKKSSGKGKKTAKEKVTQA